MVCSLEGPHSHNSLNWKAVVAPDQVRIVNVIFFNLHLEVVTHNFAHDRIFREEAVRDELGIAHPDRLFASRSCFLCLLRASHIVLRVYLTRSGGFLWLWCLCPDFFYLFVNLRE